MSNSNNIVCLMGPTASGKTDLAVKLLEHFQFEIISVDSAMIYREMNIGTAKPDANLLAIAPHHLIDIRDPNEIYSAAEFCDNVSVLIDQIIAKGKIPLLVGGTMMYFRALQQGLSLLPVANIELRKELLHKALEHGWHYMHQELMRVDPISATRIHPNDTQRIQRALEVYQITNKPLSEFFNNTNNVNIYNFINFSLLPNNRAWLHQRIADRFQEMLANGFIAEVEALLQKWQLNYEYPSMRCVGYRQALSYLKGECNYDDFVAHGIAATRQLAKRQLTWLNKWENTQVFVAEDQSIAREIIANLDQILDN